MTFRRESGQSSMRAHNLAELYDLEALTRIGSQRVLGIPIPAIVFLVVVALGWVVLNRTRYGRYVIAVGGNREAARIAGVPVRRIIFSVYVLSGFLAGISTDNRSRTLTP